MAATSVTGAAGGAIEESVPRTSMIRSAQTAARGIMTAMKVAIMTDIRMSVR